MAKPTALPLGVINTYEALVTQGRARAAADVLGGAMREIIAAEIEAFADDHSDVSDAYRHAALIAKGFPGP